MTSQIDYILAHLRIEGALTPLQALDLYGCFRLAARVSDLRAQGFPIVTEWLTTENGRRVARYRLLSEPVQMEAFG